MTRLKVGSSVSLLNGDGIIVDVQSDQTFMVLTSDGDLRHRSLDLPMVSLNEPPQSADLAQGKRLELDDGSVLEVTSRGKLLQLPNSVAQRLDPTEYSVDEAVTEGIHDPLPLCKLRATTSTLRVNASKGDYQSLSGNEIRIEPYQIDAAHTVLEADIPRFLIADEVGLGKTIETGIILEELRARGEAERVLIAAPASLVEQWREELMDKFGREYVVFDRDMIETRQQQSQTNPWDTANAVITSIDFIKQEEIRDQLSEVAWDVAVFDEAHHLTARRHEGYIDPTDRYRAGETVAERTDALLLLTGTPHKGKRDQFFYLLRLLRPHMFRRPEHVSAKRVNEVMIRRLKTDNDIVDADGNPKFPPREISTLPVELSPKERALYEDISEYIRDHYAERLSTNSEASHRIAGYALSVYQKRLVSSIRSIESSLRNHRAGLKAARNPSVSSENDEELVRRYYRDPSSLSEDDQKRAEELATQAVAVDSTGQVESDIDQVSGLIERAAALEQDSKAKKLISFVAETLEADSTEKVLIFTEYTDTLVYLRDEVLDEYTVAQIHGGMSQTRRRQAQEQFKDDAEILVATDAAREGINLQFAHIMVNYDLPWNPIRIDQRIGRLHRYGQERTVSVYNLFISDSREDRVLQRLTEKVNQIEEDLGIRSDVLGTVLDTVDVEQHVEDAIRENRAADEVAADLESIIDDRLKAQERVQEQFLTRDQFAMTDAQRITDLLEESEMEATANQCRELVETCCRVLDGEMTPLDSYSGGVWQVALPTILACKNRIDDEYRPVTFDRTVAVNHKHVQLLSASHPLLEVAIDYIRSTPQFGGQFGYGRHPETGSGMLCRFEITCLFGESDATAEETTIDVFVADDGATSTDYAVEDATPLDDETATERADEAVMSSLVSQARQAADQYAEQFSSQLQSQRDASLSDRLEDVTADFDERMRDRRERIDNYREKADREGIDMQAPINREQSRLDELATQRAETLSLLHDRKQLTDISIELITAIRTVGS